MILSHLAGTITFETLTTRLTFDGTTFALTGAMHKPTGTELLTRTSAPLWTVDLAQRGLHGVTTVNALSAAQLSYTSSPSELTLSWSNIKVCGEN